MYTSFLCAINGMHIHIAHEQHHTCATRLMMKPVNVLCEQSPHLRIIYFPAHVIPFTVRFHMDDIED